MRRSLKSMPKQMLRMTFANVQNSNVRSSNEQSNNEQGSKPALRMQIKAVFKATQNLSIWAKQQPSVLNMLPLKPHLSLMLLKPKS